MARPSRSAASSDLNAVKENRLADETCANCGWEFRVAPEADTFRCPQCKVRLRRDPDGGPGDQESGFSSAVASHGEKRPDGAAPNPRDEPKWSAILSTAGAAFLPFVAMMFLLSGHSNLDRPTPNGPVATNVLVVATCLGAASVVGLVHTSWRIAGARALAAAASGPVVLWMFWAPAQHYGDAAHCFLCLGPAPGSELGIVVAMFLLVLVPIACIVMFAVARTRRWQAVQRYAPGIGVGAGLATAGVALHLVLTMKYQVATAKAAYAPGLQWLATLAAIFGAALVHRRFLPAGPPRRRRDPASSLTSEA
jgi:hypothetical protein